MQQATQADGASTTTQAGSNLPPENHGRFVINLMSSTTPSALAQPTHPNLRHYRFFTSRRREDGRERFRLHMGYFSSQEEAERLLPVVRQVYPGAWAGMAPGQRLNGAPPLPAPSPPISIEVIDAGATGTVPALAPPATPIAAPAVTAAQPLSSASSPEAPTAAPVVPPAARSARQTSSAEQSLRSVRDAIASLDGQQAVAHAAEALKAPRPQALTEPQVLKVLEPAPAVQARAPGPAGQRHALAHPAAPPAPAPVATPELPLFAVQLHWSVQAFNVEDMPQLAIFSAYTLYRAEGNRDGRRWYGLRLGFFTDAISARQVAHYVRSEFAGVSIVPVSMRERERAVRAAARQAIPAEPKPRVPRRSTLQVEEFKFIEDRDLTTRDLKAVPASEAKTSPGAKAAPAPAAARVPTSAQVSVAPDPASVARAQAAAAPAKPASRPAARAQSVAKAKTARPRSGPLSLEETLEILGANELQMDSGASDPLNDSGVRHLHTEVRKAKQNSRLGRLFGRLAQKHD